MLLSPPKARIGGIVHYKVKQCAIIFFANKIEASVCVVANYVTDTLLIIETYVARQDMCRHIENFI